MLKVLEARGNHSCHVKPPKNTPLFDGVIFCLARIPGEIADSGHILCLDGEAKLANILANHERFSEESLEPVPDRRTGFIPGQSGNKLISQTPDPRRGTRSLRPPIFPGTFPVWQ